MLGCAVRILRGGDAAKDLQVDGGEVMIGIGIELALKLGIGRDFDGFAGGVGVGLGAGQAVDGRVVACRAPSMWSKERFSIMRTTTCLKFRIPGSVLSSMNCPPQAREDRLSYGHF